MTESSGPILNVLTSDTAERLSRAAQCALAVLAKAPRPGTVKTRLSPPLTLAQAAELNVCFLRDTTENIAAVASGGRSSQPRAAGLVAYTPVGDEALFDGLLPAEFALVAQRGDGFGERLLAAAEDILACGYGSVCLIDSDSPTVPRAAYEKAVAELERPGDRVVLGPAADGGYYLIGLKKAHAAAFERIQWSTETVAADTRERLCDAGIELVELPMWYDVDDGPTLDILKAELLAGKPPEFATQTGYPAPHTRAFLLAQDLASTTALEPLAETRDQLHRFWATARPWITNAALLAIGAVMLLLSRQLVSEYSHFTIGFSGVSGWSATLYVIAVALILTQPVNRFTLPIVVTVAVGCRLATLFAEPYLSSDIYRYVWDGIVQHAHISPYRYVPGDPALVFLRSPHQYVFDHINRRDYAHTIYPPIAQMLFYVITAISPTVTFMKTAMVLFEGVTVAALVALLKHLGQRPEQALLYAWCPLLFWEIAGSGHLDSAAMAFIALALLARYRRLPVVTGIFLGIAVMLKFYPLVLFPALWWRDSRPSGSAWKMPTAVAGVIAFGYASYAGVGMRVFGFLGGYAHEEGLGTGARYFLLDLMKRIPGLQDVPTSVFYGICALVFGALMLWAWKIACQPESAPEAFLAPAFALATALMLLFSPHYAWYIIWLVPFFALLPNLPGLAYLMGFFYLYTTALAVPGPKMFLLNEYLYGLTLAAFVLWMAARRWPLHRRYMAPGR
jgi:alpha-1,6-mannosyltransferase